MKVTLTDIQVNRHINPRFEVDSDYIDELMKTDHLPAVIVTREMGDVHEKWGTSINK